MKTRLEIEGIFKKLKPILAKEYKVERIGYFGSFAEGNQTMESDLDVLVEFSQPLGWKFFSLEKFLEEKFGLKIDLVTTNALKQQLKKKILKQVVFV